ncbi:MAG: hypothetical protein ABUS79_07010 [Pseudomonadota bacterium]
MNPFETETMADLCLRQGHPAEALTIYRRLVQRPLDAPARARIERRIASLEGDARGTAKEIDPPLAVPAVRARWSGDVVTVEWRLPPRTPAPGLEVLLVRQGPAGVETETRAIAVDGDAGRITLTVSGLHLARAAAGTRAGGHFVPVARG